MMLIFTERHFQTEYNEKTCRLIYTCFCLIINISKVLVSKSDVFLVYTVSFKMSTF